MAAIQSTEQFLAENWHQYPDPIKDRAQTVGECVLVFLDMESYYDNDYSLSRVTTEAYIRDPRFEVIMLSIKIGKEPMRIITGTMAEIGSQLSEIPWHRVLLVAHNSAFDASILSYRWGFIPRFILCTARMAAPFFSNVCGVSLKALAEHFQLPAKGTAVHDMKGKRRLDLSPQEFEEYAAYCAHDTWLCEQLFWKLLPKLPEHELYSLHATLMMTVHPTLRLDTATLETMLADEHEHRETLYQRTIDLLGTPLPIPVLKSVLSSNDKFPQLLSALGVEVGTKLNAKGEVKPALAKTDPAMDELLHCDDVLIRTLAEARLQAKSTQAESRAQRFLEIASRGPMPFPLLWCGADVTGRWSADSAFKSNTQNLGRGSPLRDAIRAPEGYQIIVADLSQIELRFGWWLAGEHDKLAAFATGNYDPYKQIYSDTFLIPLDLIDKKSVERQCGKVVQLSGIFGTGHEKVRHTIRIQAGKTISLAEAKMLIDTYRRGHQHVVSAWKIGERAIEALYGDQNMPLWQPGFEVVSSRDSPFGVPSIRKPDGMFLTRPGVGFQWGTWPSGEKKKEWFYNRRKGKNIVRDYIYGGKVFQSAVQGGARDIFSRAIAQIARQLPYGCYIAGVVHDEGLFVVPDNYVDEVKALVRREMTTSPWWAPDLPLAVDIDVGTIYGEIK